jgi:hypothetical protein
VTLDPATKHPVALVPGGLCDCVRRVADYGKGLEHLRGRGAAADVVRLVEAGLMAPPAHPNHRRSPIKVASSEPVTAPPEEGEPYRRPLWIRDLLGESPDRPKDPVPIGTELGEVSGFGIHKRSGWQG